MTRLVSSVLATVWICLILLALAMDVAASEDTTASTTPLFGAGDGDLMFQRSGGDIKDIPNDKYSTTESQSLWRRRESHQTSSSVMIAENNATLWIYSASHMSEEDAINTVLKYRASPTKPVWKYEFSCQSLPNLAVAHWHGDIWALGCPSQQVPLYNGHQLTSSSGSVTLFQWMPHKGRARIVQTIYGKNSTDQLGQSISMSADGRTIALVAATLRAKQHQENPSYLDVYHYDVDKNTTTAGSNGEQQQKWIPMGETIQGVIKATLSSDGTVLAAMMANSKAVQLFSYSGTKWVPETIQTTARGGKRPLLGLSTASMSLSGNGQVLSLLQHAKGGQAINIFQRFRNNGRDGTFYWKKTSSIPAPPPVQNNNNRRSNHNQRSSFGWVASLSGDGTRIAISELSTNNGTGVVYVYDYCDGYGRNKWVPVGEPIQGQKPRDSFGRHLHLSQDGTQLIVKAVSYTIIFEFVTGTSSSGSPCEDYYDQMWEKRFGNDEL